MPDPRLTKVNCPLGPDKLFVEHVTGSERLSRLFDFRARLYSSDPDLDFDGLLGQSMSIGFVIPNGEWRWFNGLVTDMSQLDARGRSARYEITLMPWFWVLTRSGSCRIFQEKSSVDIAKSIFRDHGFSDFEELLSGSYPTREYCVQYRESDFAFVSRLLEEEGIYYYFKHEDGKHTLVLGDSVSAHEPRSDYDEVPYYAAEEDTRRERDHLDQWRVRRIVQTGAYALRDFDFERPKNDLTAQAAMAREHQHASLECYDFPGLYTDAELGRSRARTRIEELQAECEVVMGGGNAMGLGAGYLFRLALHPQAAQNREYLLTGTTYDLKDIEPETGGGGAGRVDFRCTVEAIPSAQQFRPPRATPRPVVHGAQTAIVVGKGGEEIWTDPHGRVKVQFHWDRAGAGDENSSCWVRVSQAWAGKGFGAIHIPRIGQEVIVDFLEGDPDRPIVIGRVYNADNPVPYALAANMTQSGIKSHSTKEGSDENYNEIRFEDAKGSEEVYIQAEKDKKVLVKNDRTENVGNDESITIAHNRTESVGNDEKIGIGNDRNETVGGNENVKVEKDRNHEVGGNETLSVAKDRRHEVGGNQTIAVEGNQSTSIEGTDTNTVEKKQTNSVKDERSTTIGKDETLTVGAKMKVTVENEILVKTGDASIHMKSDGTITIQGKDITIDASGDFNVKAGGDVILKGTKITSN